MHFTFDTGTGLLTPSDDKNSYRHIITLHRLQCSRHHPGTPSGRLTSDSTITLQEISISAFKQTGRMWSHPVAETTISRNQIEDYGIVTLKDASELTPNFYIPAYGSRMTSSIYVRGLGARIDQP